MEWEKGSLGNFGYYEDMTRTLEKGNSTFKFKLGENPYGGEHGGGVLVLNVAEYQGENINSSASRESEFYYEAGDAEKLIEKTIAHFEKSADTSLDTITEHMDGLIWDAQQKAEEEWPNAFEGPELLWTDEEEPEKTIEAPAPEQEAPAQEIPEAVKQEPENAVAAENVQEIEKEARGNTPEEQAFWNAVHQRKVVADALKAGTLSCLPGADGYADTAPAVNLTTGTRYHGANLLFLKEFQKQNGFPTAEYMTAEAVAKSGIPIRKGEKGVTVSFQSKNDETGEWEKKNVKLFNVAQTARPWDVKKYAENFMQEKAAEKLEFLKSQYSASYKPPEPREKQSAPEIRCSSTEPEKYLGQFLAAVSMGGKFKASPEQAKEFSQKMEASLFEKMENQHTNPFKLSKICSAAGEVCKDTIREVRNPKIERTQEQKLERTQSRARGV